MSNEPFEIIARRSAQEVVIAFDGTLAQAPVRWHARVITTGAADTAQGFIEVGEHDGNCRLLTVALPLTEIDQPALRKTVTMIRQWKRLGEGRHYFGPKQD